MIKIVFTLCSNNYLAHAKTLGDSLMRQDSTIRFVIGLVDRKDPEIDYDVFDNFEVLPYSALGVIEFEKMVLRYNVIEFNTAVKPFYIEYLFSKNGEDAIVYYVDPDIAFYSGLGELDSLLSDNNVVITPHLSEPHIKVSPFETMVLNVGIYNLGFIGVKNTAESRRFIAWWQERLISYCYIDHPNGLFVDQIWVNLVPILFEGVVILKKPGYNMACWNFHERKLLSENGKYCVNTAADKLVFFHFSGFKPENLPYVAKIKSDEFLIDNRPDLRALFEDYTKMLEDNKYTEFKKRKPLLNFGSGKYSMKQRIGLSLQFRTNKYIRRIFGI